MMRASGDVLLFTLSITDQCRKNKYTKVKSKVTKRKLLKNKFKVTGNPSVRSIDYRCEDRKQVSELRSDIGSTR
jgi:hypothetical protein